MRRRMTVDNDSSAAKLESLAQRAIHTAKKGRKHRQNLANDNYYGNKLAELRADAANVFRELSSQSVGDTTALAELTEAVFSPKTVAAARLQASRDLVYALRTTWKEAKSAKSPDGAESLFPLTILVQANRSYLCDHRASDEWVLFGRLV